MSISDPELSNLEKSSVTTFLNQILLACGLLIFAGKSVDFLIGEKARRLVKDHLVVNAWIALESASVTAILRYTSKSFHNVVVFLFGKRVFSIRACFASFITTVLLLMLLHFTTWPAGIVDLCPIVRSKRFSQNWWLGPLALILWMWNLSLDFISYAVTRNLSRKIADSKKFHRALTFWLIDGICAILIAVTAFYSAQVVISNSGPQFDRSVRIFDSFVAYQMAVTFAVTGLFPTLVHLLFFLVISILVAIEYSRRFFALILVRIDEQNTSPITLMAGGISVLSGLLVLIYKYAVSI